MEGQTIGSMGQMDHHQSFTRPVIEEIARPYQICPFEFSLDLALWVDRIICAGSSRFKSKGD